MDDPQYDVVFDGRLVDGADPARVRADLARLFKTEVAKVEHLFSGHRTVVKRSLDEEAAAKYRAAFERAGAVVTVVDAAEHAPAIEPGPAPAAPSPAASAGERDEGPSRSDLAEAARAPPPLVARGAPKAPEDMSMADVGASLVDEPSSVEPPDIDTSHLSLSEAGVDLVEREQVAAPEFDLSAYALDPPGTPLTEPGPPPRK